LNTRNTKPSKARRPQSEHRDGQHAANSTKQHKQSGNNSGNSAGNNSSRRAPKPAAKNTSGGSDSPWANSNGQRHKPS